MILLLDTTTEKTGKTVAEELLSSGKTETDFEWVDTVGMNISHCIGCNCCWLKTPGKCVIKDDYEAIMLKILHADQVWLISDTRFGFVTYQTKKLVDRIMPLITMYLRFKGTQMRHVMRYKHRSDFGLIYTGEGNQEHLEFWIKRVALNMDAKSPGAFDLSHIKEAVSCML